MQLVFAECTTLADGAFSQLGHEPNNELINYQLIANKVRNEVALPNQGEYSALTFAQVENRVPVRSYSIFGIKTFPQMGAFGWFRTKYENITHIIVPINKRTTRYDAPTVSFTIDSSSIHIEITPPSTVKYICYRILFRYEYFAIEYITYNTILDIPLPNSGEYEAYVIGYRSTGEISIETPRQILTITNTDPVVPGQSLLALSDTPNSYQGQAHKALVVDTAENKVVFGDSFETLTITLLAANWLDDLQEVVAAGVVGEPNKSTLIVAPTPTSQDAYTAAAIKCIDQDTDILQFSCNTVPAIDLEVSVIIL